jgi:uncharacterized protein with HEPN domain
MQQHKKLLKYILDIESIIEELEDIINHHNKDFTDFQKNIISVRAVERDLTIIGEAINKIVQLKPDISISGVKQIVGLRNLIVHAYDSIEPSVLWRILLKDIPVLKEEIEELK